MSGIYRNDGSQHPGHFPWQLATADYISIISKAALMKFGIHTEYCTLLVQSASDLYELEQRELEEVFA